MARSGASVVAVRSPRRAWRDLLPGPSALAGRGRGAGVPLGARTPGGATADLNAARALLPQLERERTRLAIERAELDAGTSPLFGLVGFILEAAGIDDRARSLDELIENLDDFIGGAFARLEVKAAAGDANAADDLLRAARNILGLTKSTGVLDDAIDDAVAGVKQTKDDLLGLLGQVVTGVAGTAGAVVGLGIGWQVPSVLGAPLWVRVAAAAGLGLGGGVGGVTLGRRLAATILGG